MLGCCKLSGNARFTNEAFLAFFIYGPDEHFESDAAAEWFIITASSIFPTPPRPISPGRFVSLLLDLLRKIRHCTGYGAGSAGWAGSGVSLSGKSDILKVV